MIVNVASKCGLTPQYADLQSLYGDYKDRGLSIAAFPANEFGAQEPGTNQEIGAFCAKNYGVSFDVFEKIVVKGAGQHPLYGYLTRESGFPGEIEWNFAKFLVDKSGRVVARFNAETNPRAADVVAAVEKALA
jgi:glutathione peroxidase